MIDTGIYVAHHEFEGRATFGVNFAGDGIDDDGHGRKCSSYLYQEYLTS